MAIIKVDVKNNKSVEKAVRKILATATRGVKIGIVKNPADGSFSADDIHTPEKSDATIGKIGAVHEFGTDDGTIPQRSYLRSTFEDQKENTKKNLFVEIKKQGKKTGVVDSNKVLVPVAKFLVRKIKDKFKSNDWPPLKDPTRGGKTTDGKPLLDTFTLWNSISYEVVKK